MQDHDRVGIDDGMLKLRKTLGTYKNFEIFFTRCERTSSTTTNHSCLFFGKEAPNLHAALAKFYSCICKLSTIYKWQETVLPISIETYTFIVAQQLTDPLKWVIPEKLHGKFL